MLNISCGGSVDPSQAGRGRSWTKTQRTEPSLLDDEGAQFSWRGHINWTHNQRNTVNHKTSHCALCLQASYQTFG